MSQNLKFQNLYFELLKVSLTLSKYNLINIKQSIENICYQCFHVSDAIWIYLKGSQTWSTMKMKKGICLGLLITILLFQSLVHRGFVQYAIRAVNTFKQDVHVSGGSFSIKVPFHFKTPICQLYARSMISNSKVCALNA